MSADQLAQRDPGDGTGTVRESGLPHRMEQAVLTVLTGAPVPEVALAAGLDPADLAEAVEVYRQAGRDALRHHVASGWWQVYVQFTDWPTAERDFADHLAPLLQRAENDGILTAWWFMRKYPCWRLRLRSGSAGHTMKTHLGAAFDQLTDDGRIDRWWPGIYEAETAAFGGEAGMECAHNLFCVDSRAIVNLLRHNTIGLGRRELSLLLCSTLLRAAGLERYEQGDVWHRVAMERHLPADVPTSKLTTMADDLGHLIRADMAADGPLLSANGPLAAASEWADAFHQAGHSLGTAARAGTLHRGLRDILAYAVIFHWNRLGLPARTQSILAWAARTAILDQPVASAIVQPPPQPESDTSTSRRSTTAPGDTADRAVTRFPLVFQGRRRCADLDTRVREVRTFADSCHTPSVPEDRIDRACSAWNLAALLAADCGMADLAAELCQHQFQLFQAAWPVSGRTAIASLQPLVNLARLTNRTGDHERAYRELDAINQAVRHGGDAVIHDRTVSFDGFTTAENNWSIVDKWLRSLLREEGTRALAAAGHWDKAAAHAAHYDDAAEQLREARQTSIIAHVLNGHTSTALTLIDTSVLRHPWEHAVAACLRSYTDIKAQRPDTGNLAAMLTAVQHARQHSDRATTLFRIRLGLTAIDLSAGRLAREADLVCAELIDEAQRSTDAFAAREILDHPPCRIHLPPAQAAGLTALVDRAQLSAGALPQSVLSHLMTSVHIASTVLAHSLGVTPSPDPREQN